MVLFFTHIPFVVNHTINATPPERLCSRQNIVYYNLDIEHWKRQLDVKLEAMKTRTVETFSKKSEVNEV